MHGLSRSVSVFSRRGFLVGSASLLGALAAGAALTMRSLSGASLEYRALLRDAIGERAPSVLSEKELAVLVAVVDAMIPDRDGAPSAREVGVALRIDSELRFQGEKLVRDVKSALFVVEHGGVLHASTS